MVKRQTAKTMPGQTATADAKDQAAAPPQFPRRPAARCAPITAQERAQRMAQDVARRAAMAAAPSWPHRCGQPPIAVRGLAMARQEAARRFAAAAEASSASDCGGGGFEPSSGAAGMAEGRQARAAEARAMLETLTTAIGPGAVAVDGNGGRVAVLALVQRVAIYGDGLSTVLQAHGIKRSRGRVAALFDALDAAAGRMAQAVGLERPGKGMPNGIK